MSFVTLIVFIVSLVMKKIVHFQCLICRQSACVFFRFDVHPAGDTFPVSQVLGCAVFVKCCSMAHVAAGCKCLLCCGVCFWFTFFAVLKVDPCCECCVVCV